MDTKTIILDSFEHNGKEYQAEASVTYSINVEDGDLDTPSSSEIDIEGVEIWELNVYRPAFNDWVECNQSSIAKAVIENIKNNFEI